MITLVTGAARSGKTAYALGAAKRDPKVYVATAELLDAEMIERARLHRKERGNEWKTVEEPRHLAAVLEREAGVIVIDCLTLWLSNWYLKEPSAVDGRIAEIARAMRNRPADVIAITNEVGWSIVPENPVAREFRDWSGRMNQRIAAIADEVVLMVCGIPMRVK